MLPVTSVVADHSPRGVFREVFTPAGRRAVLRRFMRRLLVFMALYPWVFPLVGTPFNDELLHFVRGQVVDPRSPDTPLAGVSVLLVPVDVVDEPQFLVALEASFSPSRTVYLWTDLDGLFSDMHVASDVWYQLVLRRPGCVSVSLGERSFHLFRPFGRRLHLVAPPCVSDLSPAPVLAGRELAW